MLSRERENGEVDTIWQDLSPEVRRTLIGVGAIDAGLRIAALVDLARRPDSQIKGSKAVWGVALALVNSAGALPVAYFAWAAPTTQPENGSIRKHCPLVMLGRTAIRR